MEFCVSINLTGIRFVKRAKRISDIQGFEPSGKLVLEKTLLFLGGFVVNTKEDHSYYQPGNTKSFAWQNPYFDIAYTRLLS